MASSTPLVQATSLAEKPWRQAGAGAGGSRTNVTSRSRPCCRARHSSSLPASSTRAQSVAGAPSHSGSTRRVSRSSSSGEIHVGACTPLVTEPIGTSSVGTSGHSPANMARLTAPCSAATPLRRAASRRPMTAMLKRVSPGSSARRPRAISSSKLTPHSAANEPKYRSMSSTREAVDPGRHRRVGGEDAPGPHGFDRLGERQALAHELADPLQPEEAGVPLVGVEHLRLEAQRLQGADAADAEEDLLADAVLGVAAVEPIGHESARPGCCRPRRCRAGRAAPGRRRRARPGPGGGSPARSTVTRAPSQRVSGKCVGIELGEALLLHAVDGQELAEVARPVEEAHADQGHAEVARRLEVVAGEDAQAAGVLRQRLRDAELGREVGHQPQRARAAGSRPWSGTSGAR